MTSDTATRTHPARFSPAGAGLPAPLFLYVQCGCKARRVPGSIWLGRVPMRCAKCAGGAA